MSKRTPFVYVTNLGAHDYTHAEKYGELRFLTRGKINRYATSTIYREFVDAMEGSDEEDFLLVSSLSILVSIAAAILARKHGIVNFLLFSDGRYVIRKVNIAALIDGTNGGFSGQDTGSDGT